MPINEKKLLRILDANINRAKEGLRVCEDLCRFVQDDKESTRLYKDIRHQLTVVLGSFKIKDLLDARDVEADSGKESVPLELKRTNLDSIFYANSQRVKESMRVLEELAKLLDRRAAGEIKKLRYSVYVAEKKVAQKFCAS